ncbi:AAA family ATPase [Dactylosporangium sp. CA-139066]|uniref:AAA family ATPase n=1 Tax=Dactylosporangium sp. CA-139066 TaxID=3239930 RepID=UPI003D8F67C1
MTFTSAADLAHRLDEAAGYLAEPGLAAAAYLAYRGRRPLLLEGAPGVGKTAFAGAMAKVLGTRVERVQCHAGLDAERVLYDWNYAAQMLALRAAGEGDHSDRLPQLWDEKYLIARPILSAVRDGPAVLLIDEFDRAEDEFEALLLQVLDTFEVTVPELGTFTAQHPPFVVLTSNRTREAHDAIKRRCFYHWIRHPAPAREAEILRRHVLGLSPELAGEIAGAMAQLRRLELAKPPSLAEAIDFARAVTDLGATDGMGDVAEAALGTLVKQHEDEEAVRTVLVPQQRRP